VPVSLPYLWMNEERLSIMLCRIDASIAEEGPARNEGGCYNWRVVARWLSRGTDL